jgi:hypothetical protein
VAYFQVLPPNLNGETEENDETSVRIAVSRARFDVIEILSTVTWIGWGRVGGCLFDSTTAAFTLIYCGKSCNSLERAAGAQAGIEPGISRIQVERLTAVLIYPVPLSAYSITLLLADRTVHDLSISLSDILIIDIHQLDCILQKPPLSQQ